MTANNYLESGFEKIHGDLRFLIACFAEVLEELGQPELAQALPWTQTEWSRTDVFPDRLGQAYALAFQLLNMIEENVAAMTRRSRENNEGLDGEKGLWGYVLGRLKEKGVTEAQLTEVLQAMRVEPVLTVHPTEAKRAAVLEQHRALFLLLFQRENPIWTTSEKNENREQIKTAIERLWRTGEILISKPDIDDERRNLLYYLREVFPAALPGIDSRLRQAWTHAGYDRKYFEGPQSMPRLHFGTWVGGDRDGHPLVTANTTRETLHELRQNALLVLHRQLSALWERLPLSSLVQSPPPELQQHIARLREELGPRAQRVLENNEEESWRQFVALLMAKLPLDNPFEAEPDAAAHRTQSVVAHRYRISRELEDDLEILARSLHEVGAARLAQTDLLPVRRAVEVFGFHLASLDIRQNSRFHDVAMSQLLQAARVQWKALDVADFAHWPEAERQEFLLAELESPRPFLHAGTPVAPEADAVLDCYRVLARHIAQFGPRGLGALIISMTRQLSDLMVVYLLAREAGLAYNGNAGLECRLPVVPLFETEDDLRRGSGILRDFLAHPVTQRSLQRQAQSTSSGGTAPSIPRPPVQQVMIGYSDSNKDSGILASQWALQQAQRAISQIGEEFGIHIRFFHGRGGTISRGAGPTHRFLEALPSGSLGGDLRLTEQGETIAQKYANLNTATHNLELLMAGVTGVAVRHKYFRNTPHALEPIVEQMAGWSRNAYHRLLQMDGFMTFFESATPIDALEHASIGSRPSRRSGRRELDDLRAIPWVFSWNQSRFYLPGWYGIGTALKRLCNENPRAWKQLQAEINAWPFLRYVLTNVETNLASADLALMEQYAGLVEDQAVRHNFMGEIAAEYARSREMLANLFGHSFEVRRPRMHQTLQLRASALQLLHRQQIQLLSRWRTLRKEDNEEAAAKLLPDLLLSINAIASGLRTTG